MLLSGFTKMRTVAGVSRKIDVAVAGANDK